MAGVFLGGFALKRQTVLDTNVADPLVVFDAMIRRESARRPSARFDRP